MSTIAIFWFAGSSAMAGLVTIVPRYLPRYGMAPIWAHATRPLVLVFTLVAFVVTISFRADVDAQGGAYATGVLMMMSSAALAVMLSYWRQQLWRWAYVYGLITLVFTYTTLINIYERPEGLQVSGIFILAIVVASMISRIWRSTEVRFDRFVLDKKAETLLHEAEHCSTLRFIANRRDVGDGAEYRAKELEVRADTHIPLHDKVLFSEITIDDPSEFAHTLEVKGVEVGRHQILRIAAPAVPNAIAAFLLYVRDRTGKVPHAYFGWAEGNPLQYLLRFILFGEGDIAPVTREVLRRAEHDDTRRPGVHVGG